MNNLITKKQVYILISSIAIFLLIGLLPDNGPRPAVLVKQDQENISNLTEKTLALVVASAEKNTELSYSFAMFSQDFIYKDTSIENMFLEQMKKHFQNASIPLRIESSPEFVLYSFKNGEDTEWIIWLNENFTDASDLTANFPTEGSMVLTERFTQEGEVEPLTRGYLIENGVAKIVVSSTPIFVTVE